MDYNHKAIVEKIERACRREMKRTERDYDDLINSYTDIEATNGTDAHILGWITSEDFQAKKDEDLDPKAYEAYDALCEPCYLSELLPYKNA